VVESGIKVLRGQLTEGRNLIFRPTTGTSIQVTGTGKLGIQKTSKKGSQQEAFSVHQYGEHFAIKSAHSGSCLTTNGKTITLTACNSASWDITYNGESATYQITHAATGKHLSAGSGSLQLSTKATSFKVYSVSF
jgi:hypothetical protein